MVRVGTHWDTLGRIESRYFDNFRQPFDNYAHFRRFTRTRISLPTAHTLINAGLDIVLAALVPRHLLLRRSQAFGELALAPAFGGSGFSNLVVVHRASFAVILQFSHTRMLFTNTDRLL
jgi:hypothetical protein